MQRLQHEPSWSADGKHVYFLSGGGGQSHDIWRVNIASLETGQLTANQLYHFDVAISNLGELAFSSNRSGNYEIWVSGKGKPARRITEHLALDARPSWSPDSNSIVFESTRLGQQAIWSMDLASKRLAQLTKPGQPARYPVWFQGAAQ